MKRDLTQIKHLDTRKDRYEIGSRIQQKRKELDISPTVMAVELGISTDAYRHIECGSTMCSLKHLYVIAQYLNVSTDYLLYGEERQCAYDDLEVYLKTRDYGDLRRALAVLKAVFD